MSGDNGQRGRGVRGGTPDSGPLTYMTQPHLAPQFSIAVPVNRSFRYSSVPFIRSVKSLLFNHAYQGLS